MINILLLILNLHFTPLSEHSEYTKNAFYYIVVEDSLKVKTFFVKNNGWGYDILLNNKQIIHQPNIPGRSGTKGFLTQQDAIKVSSLVVEKIRKKSGPPSITEIELKSLNIK